MAGPTLIAKLKDLLSKTVTFEAEPDVNDAAAATAAAVAGTIPAGGTGQAAGGWDTAEHRDTAIATIEEMIVTVNALVDDVADIRTQLNDLLATLRTGGVLESS